jgi:hypothetical protein
MGKNLPHIAARDDDKIPAQDIAISVPRIIVN